MSRSHGPGPPAVLVGLDSMQGLQLARILAGHGVEVIALVADGSFYATKSRSIAEVVVADTKTEALIETLVDIGRRLEGKAVLFPCQDESVKIVSEHRHRLDPWFLYRLPPRDVVDMLMDKASFIEFANEHGFPIPESHIIRSRQDIQTVADTIGYPCVLKPPYRTPEWEIATKAKAFRIEQRADLVSHWERYSRWSDVFIVQSWIEGTDEDLYSCNAYFDDSGACVATFVARKLRQWPPVTGQSCLGEEVRADPVRDTTIEFFGSIPYSGYAYLEMKRDIRTGRFLIVEPNIGRPTGRSAIAEAGGVDLHYAMYCDVVGLPLPGSLVQQYTGVKWIHLLRDLQSAWYYWRSGDLSIGHIVKSWRGKKAYAVWSLRDPLPFLWALVRAIPTALEERSRHRNPVNSEPGVTGAEHAAEEVNR